MDKESSCSRPFRWARRQRRTFRLETANAGGHSSIPIRDNAIYELSEDLLKVRDHEFPLKMTATTRAMASTGSTNGEAYAPYLSGRDFLTDLVKLYADAD